MRILPFRRSTKPVPSLNTVELDRIRQECLALVKKSSYASAGAAIVPIPFADLAIDSGILSQILPEISERFGVGKGRTKIYDSETKQINWSGVAKLGVDIASIVASRGVTKKAINGFGVRLLTKQVAKFIPLGGQLVAATMGYFTMKKIVTAHIDECYAQALAKKNGQAV